MKLFKPTDEIEKKVADALIYAYQSIDLGRSDFYAGAWTAEVFGDVLFEEQADAMARAIGQDIYRTTFPAIHQLFTRPGTFEFYMDVFRKIWGDDVLVTFTIPGPGELEINIEALGLELLDAQYREIVDDLYTYGEIITSDTFDNLAFQGSKGIKTQAEVDTLMKELHPTGIIVTTTLVI